jgi:hypothetical protein
LTERHHFALCLRASLAFTMSFLLVGGLAGCHRKSIRTAMPHGVLAPVELEAAPVPDVEIATVPAPELAPPLPPPPPVRPTPRKRPAAPKEETPPPQVASAPEPATLAIGALSTGDVAPESLQQARDLIASILKRIDALPTKTADSQKKQVSQVRHFLDQAQKALNSGDAEGAFNLATKAKLLMDDLEKK